MKRNKPQRKGCGWMERIDVKRGLSIVVGICMLAAAGLGAMAVTVQMRNPSQSSESTQESGIPQKKESEKTVDTFPEIFYGRQQNLY